MYKAAVIGLGVIEPMVWEVNTLRFISHVATRMPMKQVSACEYNPFEAVQTNIIGTKNVVDAAIDRDVKKVIFISTDKAVNPINLYGATKLCAKKMVVQANFYSIAKRTHFSVCRVGMVT